MASTSEVGHNKNVANFGAAYQIFEEMGALYNPSNANLKLTNLAPIKTALSGVITILNTENPIYKNAVADRETEIEPLGKITTQALNAAKSTTISAANKENLESQAKKIRGDVKPKKINPETAKTEEISTSQMSYDSRIANLDTFTSQLESHPEYAPNETEIKIVTLKAYHNRLATLSSAVNAAGDALITARKNRNDILYFNQNNIMQLIKEIKAYLKSLGKAGEPYYKALVKLQFKDINK
ncbi:MAG: hypothetical protein H7239_09295 [Flavobacterium sp.]|nr:hypothetical protein [Flavobacterium sp.]